VLGATYQCAPTKDSHYDDEIDRSPAHSPGFESSHGLTEPDKSIPDGAFYSKTVAKSDMEEVADSSIAGTLGPISLIRSPLAWHVAFCFVTTTVGGMYIAGTYKTYIQKSFGSSDERTTASNEAFISTVGTIAAIFNASGRMLWGAIADRAGNMTTLMALSLVFAILLGTYSFSSALGRVGITLWTFGIFLCEGGNFALYMPLIVELFGSKFAGSNYGLVFTFYSLCNVITISVLAGEDVDFLHATVITSSITLTGLFNLLLLRCHIQSYSTISQNIES
jgi:MFS family permease